MKKIMLMLVMLLMVVTSAMAQADKIILVDKVTYNAEEKIWDGGKIYDPTSGKEFKVEMSFKDNKTLTVKGMWGPFNQKMYWTKIQ